MSAAARAVVVPSRAVVVVDRHRRLSSAIEYLRRRSSAIEGPCFAMLGDPDGLAQVRVQTDISVKWEGSRGRSEGRGSRILLSLEDRVVGPAATLSAGSERELRGAAFRVLRCDLDLLHELSHRAFPGNTGWPSVGHGPAPRIA